MKAIVDNCITIIEPTKKMIDWAKRELVLDNPEYYKLMSLNKWVGSTPKTIPLYSSFPDRLVVPFGCLQFIWKEFKGEIEIFSKIRPLERICYKSDIKPYDYQENAIQSVLAKKNGILLMPTGSGKTQAGLEIIARVGGRALWLTHTQDLLNQSKERAESVLDIGDGTFGTITSGKVNVGSHITFATVQTMSMLDLEQFKNYFDIIVTDEVHHAAGGVTKVTQFYKVLSSLSARYKIGLTATLKRADHLEKSVIALIGEVVHEVSRDAVKSNTCPLVVKRIQTGYTPSLYDITSEDGTLDYAKMVRNLIEDEDRFAVVMDTINSLDGSVMVLANRVEYLQRMKDHYKGRAVCLSAMGNTKKAKAERRKALEQLKAGEIDAIFASYKLASEGLDVPTLRYVVLATPEKFETTVVQSVGRVMRKADGKACGTAIDFCDNFMMFRRWQKEREKFYKKLGAEIIDI